MPGPFNVSSSASILKQRDRKSRVCFALKIPKTDKASRYDESIAVVFRQLIVETFTMLRKIDPTIDIIPWLSGKNMTPLNLNEISSMNLHGIFFQRLHKAKDSVLCDVQIKYESDWNDIMKFARVWLNDRGHRIHMKKLQVENSRPVGCLLGSFRDLGFDLTESLKRDHHIMVDMRWLPVDMRWLPVELRYVISNRKPSMALQVWADNNDHFFIKEKLSMIYANDAKIFPLGVKLEFVEGSMGLEDIEKQGNFLESIESSDALCIKSLDSSIDDLPSLRCLILRITGKDNSPLFISVNNKSNDNCTKFSITYLVQNKSEALDIIKILPTYIIQKYGVKAKKYLKGYSINTSLQKEFERKEEKILTDLNSKRYNDDDHVYNGAEVDTYSRKRLKTSNDEVLDINIKKKDEVVKPKYPTTRIATDEFKKDHINMAIQDEKSNPLLHLTKRSIASNQIISDDAFPTISIKLGIVKKGGTLLNFIRHAFSKTKGQENSQNPLLFIC